MLNNITIVGRLTRHPEMRHTKSGTSVCNFNVAVERDYTNKQGEKEVDYIRVTAWGQRAENCSKYLSKGSLVGVEGKLYINQDKDETGRVIPYPFINAGNVKFLDFSKNSETENDTEEDSDDDYEEDRFEVPF